MSDNRVDRALKHLELVLESSRYVMAIPVVLLLLATLGTFVYGAVLFVDSVRLIVHHPFPIGRNVGLLILLVDVLLVGATLFIAAYGFYELFISKNDSRQQNQGQLPDWLVMRDLNDLKVRVVSMLVLVSAVSFVDVVVDFQSGRDVLYLGAGISLVIVALAVFNRIGVKDHA
jgi:uncharacterized protein (TIGR00645 family)